MGCLGGSPEDHYLKGHISSYEIAMMEINVHECEPERLPAGELCMNEIELMAYWETKFVFVGGTTNYIDFEDIENPVKTLLKAIV